MNTDSPCPMRASGEAPGCFAMEAAMDVRFLDRPDPHVNPRGARGFGEIGLVGLPGAIASALFHATGKRVRSRPVTFKKPFDSSRA